MLSKSTGKMSYGKSWQSVKTVSDELHDSSSHPSGFASPSSHLPSFLHRTGNGAATHMHTTVPILPVAHHLGGMTHERMPPAAQFDRERRLQRGPAITPMSLRSRCFIALLALILLGLALESFYRRGQDAKGCEMTYMYPGYVKMDFQPTVKRLAKYSLYLYRERDWRGVSDEVRIFTIDILGPFLSLYSIVYKV